MTYENDYPELLRQLELATLAYHTYNQTLAYPLDPWFEAWGSLRDLAMKVVRHTYGRSSGLRGPDCRGDTARGFHKDIDPILSSYQRENYGDPDKRDFAFNPSRPWITSDGELFRLYEPAGVAGKVGHCHLIEYTDIPLLGVGGRFIKAAKTRQVTRKISDDSGRKDHLYAFEGGTGKRGNRSWSIIGIILDHELSSGGYEVNIAFRGSQSGDALRAARQGLFQNGNPDWVTDMHPGVSAFHDAAVTAQPTIAAALSDIGTRRQSSPSRISITGHSLGGALAIRTALVLHNAVHRQSVQPDHPNKMWQYPNWKYNELELITFSAPESLGITEAFKTTIDATRVWVDGDPIVIGQNYLNLLGAAAELFGPVGRLVALASRSYAATTKHVGKELELGEFAVFDLDNHRTQELFQHLSVGKAGSKPTWTDYSSMAQAVGAWSSTKPLGELFGDMRIETHRLALLLRKVAEYQSTCDQISANQRKILGNWSSILQDSVNSSVQSKPLHADRLKELQDEIKRTESDGHGGMSDLHQLVKVALICRRGSQSNLSLKHLISNPAIRQAVERKLKPK